ncbi:hypothetical protein PAMC26577_21665 [Caballeronia sordidicola]|uniref:Uncharacterized protein n=1 Tax=Caballeronia sordidicola TaxID=196367 RepID=A0A242MLU3_CABSO|nr:hypothetical protein PAMC26577_21665 [Caballeronia sordidicola]
MAACDLSADDGVPVDATGGIALAQFLSFFDSTVKPNVRAIFTGENSLLS